MVYACIRYFQSSCVNPILISRRCADSLGHHQWRKAVKDDQWAYCKICVFDIDRNHNKYGNYILKKKVDAYLLAKVFIAI